MALMEYCQTVFILISGMQQQPQNNQILALTHIAFGLILQPLMSNGSVDQSSYVSIIRKHCCHQI